MENILKSSMFEAVFRNDILMVKFIKGKVIYVYLGISDSDIYEMNKVESKGKYLHHVIKPKYKFEKTKYTKLEDCYKNYIV